MRAFEDFPDGVVNVVTGFGDEAGAPLVAHRDVEVVAFTGSQATGRKVAVACAEQLKKCHLELGATTPSSWTRASTSTWPRGARPGPAS